MSRFVGRLAGVLASVLVLVACNRAATPEPEPQPPEPEAPEKDPRVAELAAIADAIDPGPQKALLDGMPGWVLLAAGLPENPPSDPVELLRLADQEMAAFEAGAGGPNALLVQVLALARAGAYLEMAAAQGIAEMDTLARLERVYEILDAPLLASEGLFGQLLRTFVSAAAAEGLIDDARKIDELGMAVFSALERAGALHQHTVAELLRRAPDHEAVPRALAAAAAAVRADDDALAIRMAKLSVEMRGDDVEARHLLELANLCHRALDLECGARALAAAKMNNEHAAEAARASDEAVTGASELAEHAARVIELEKAEGFEERLERARRLHALERYVEAKTAFEGLRRDAPNDARPVGGLAKIAVDTKLDLFGANAIIDGAGPLENGDTEYYELAIGTRATYLVSAVLPALAEDDWPAAMRALVPLLARMRTDIAAFEKLGSTDARYLRFVQRMVEDAMPTIQAKDDAGITKIVRGLLARAMEVQAEIPDNPHAYRLMVAATQFAADEALAVQALERAVPGGPEAPKLTLRWLQGWQDLAVTWDDAEVAQRLVAEVQGAVMRGELPPGGERVAADARAISSRLGGQPEWAAVVASYQALIEDPAESTDGSALNNLAVALIEAGQPGAARPLLERAVEVGGDWGQVARLNLAIQRRSPEDVLAVMDLTEAGSRDVIRLAASAWLVELVTEPKLARAAKKKLRAMIAKERPNHLRPQLTPGKAGVALEGNFEIGLGYSSKKGLEINLDSASKVWLTFPPPGQPF